MNRRTILRFLSTSALALGLLSSLPAFADGLDNVKKAGVLRVAVPQDFPPFGTVGADMKPQGYDIDMAALIAKEMGVKLELIPVSSTNRIPYLTTGKADLVISSLGKNPDREKVIDFTIAYAPFYNGVFGPADVKAASAADLAGKSIAVTRGSVEDLELTKIAPATAVIKRFEDNNTTISAYLSGQTQLAATGNVVAAALNERTKLRPLTSKFLIKNSPCFVGVNKGEVALIARVNEVITKAKKDGSLNQIALKWLRNPLPAEL
ncbi:MULTISPECIES: transporter substrate-binding domain-containing protein [unclassified Uliginosibacterium]|uniref:transporter substrate-binding domain-containing protein n=1 Tax=unclassified Uliginosibacterium TaxID=2621521 RepID=UPI000C7999C0|nr:MULTISPECIES: transporter substrate-binding domain-containing protein [unclassified Uliginosibacterium]MDO6388111.1 transporter substrate-binding domain-containing protein [Uliginosibacterium sp. 31-12]PLK49071.1 amino acid ABC transporter substrate-binding protein [Uliginosibacterium sp. TH139]